MTGKQIVRGIDTLNEKVGSYVAFLVIPVIGIISYEVTARFVFNAPTIWAGDVTTLVYGVLVALLGGYALLYDGHVRVDILFERLSPRGKAMADLITAPFAFVFVASFLWFATEIAIDATASREVLNTVFAPPTFPLRLILALGVLLLLLQMIAKVIRNVQIVREHGDEAATTAKGTKQ